jgi:hypothetical protein
LKLLVSNNTKSPHFGINQFHVIMFPSETKETSKNPEKTNKNLAVSYKRVSRISNCKNRERTGTRV